MASKPKQITLTDDDVNRIGISAEAALPDSAPLTDDDVNRIGFSSTPIDPNESRATQMLLNGLTFGLRPRIEAALETGSMSGPDYDKARDTQWARDDAYAKLNPVRSLALETTGALPTMVVPGLGAGRVAQAAARTGAPAAGLSRAQRLMRASGFGGEIGSVGAEAGAMGAKSAALASGLASREDTPQGRVTDAAIGAPFGYGLGRGGSAIGTRLAAGAEELVDMGRVGGSANLGAITALRRGLERDGVTTDQLRASITPQTGRAQIMPGGHRAILDAYGAEVANGATDVAARQAAARAYNAFAQASGSNLAPGTLAAHVRRVVGGYMDANEIPMAIDEVARLAGGRGQNMSWTRRAAAASPSEGREGIFNAVTSRQEDIIPAVRERINQTLGDSHYERNLRSLTLANREAEGQLYRSARNAEVPFDLSSVFDEVNATYAFRGGDAKRLMSEASQIMRGNPLPDGGYERHTIDTYIQSRGQLNDLIDSSMRQNGDGTTSPTTATAALMDLKRKMNDIVGALNPAWRTANKLTAGGRSVENTMRDGERMKLSMSDGHTRRMVNRVEELRQSARNLSRVSTPTAEQQALLNLTRNQIAAAQMGFARTVHSELSRLGDTHDVSKLFMKGGRGAQDGARRIMSVMMGDDAPRFMDMMKRAQIAGTTYKNQFNSQTTPLRETIDELNQNGKVAGAAKAMSYWLNPRAMASDLAEAISSRLNAARNTELLRRYETTTQNPSEFFALLDELDNHALQRHRAFTSPHINAYSAPALAGGAFSSAARQENERRF